MVAGMNLPLTCMLSFGIISCVLAAFGAESMIFGDQEIKRKPCKMMMSYKMIQAVCKDARLNDIPQDLDSKTEVLDARENRIRDLNNESLKPYSSLRYLYLQDNFIQHVSDSAFEPTYYLEVLDLSKNGLLDLPRNVFQMKSLRNVYLSENQLIDASFNVTGVVSPIYLLHVSGNRLTKLPKLHPLSGLTILNVSHNIISRITVDDIAPLCSLKTLDLTGNPIKFDSNTCECYEFKEWVSLRKMTLKSPQLECPSNMRESCANIDFSNRTRNLYSNCINRNIERKQEEEARSKWKWIGSFVAAFMFFIFIALACMHKHNRGKNQSLKEQKIMQANTGNTETLLNKEVNHEQS